MADPRRSRTVGAIANDQAATVTKASADLRDMYGGAIRLTLHVDGKPTAIDLESSGVTELANALMIAMRESEREYQEAHNR